MASFLRGNIFAPRLTRIGDPQKFDHEKDWLRKTHFPFSSRFGFAHVIALAQNFMFVLARHLNQLSLQLCFAASNKRLDHHQWVFLCPLRHLLSSACALDGAMHFPTQFTNALPVGKLFHDCHRIGHEPCQLLQWPASWVSKAPPALRE